ncbi:DUF6744 family protein [Aneurinibacillus thermoaerophilus]|uniref:DUF6744 family protein n=1 Tax=Aneurinibacillus thermoaerophilus TaxID=143495 RepID=UPI002E1D24C7|nr:hypothetical protein [Aneurinibacillus thermoaerophilus]
MSNKKIKGVELNHIVAKTNEAGKILGYLTWYSVSEDLHSRQTIIDLAKKAGLEEGDLPAEIRLSDAFRRATRAVEGKAEINGVRVNYLIRDVYTGPDAIIRHIVKETIDRQKKELSHESNEVVLKLDKKTEKFTASALSTEGEELAEKAKKLFELNRTHYDSSTIRRMVSKIIHSMEPTPLRNGGGVYFIPLKHKKRLISLVTFLKSLEKANGTKIPVMNDEDGREMIVENLNAHLQYTLRYLAKGLKEDLPKAMARDYIENARGVINGFKTYREMLREEVSSMEDIVRMIQKQMIQLIEKVSGKEE